MTTRTCTLQSCSKTFEAERADARYCSPTCRGKASRERRREETTVPAAPAPASTPTREGIEATPTSTKPPFPASTHPDLITRILTLEERVDDLEFDRDQAEDRDHDLGDLPARVEALARRLPTEERVREWSKKAVLDEIHGLRVRLDDLEQTLGAGDEPTEGSLTERVAALEGMEPGSDPTARAGIKRLEAHLAREIARGNEFSEQIAVLSTNLRDLATVVESKVC